ncbi:MAG TPA: hypothetical protein VHG89_04040 [Verrucomicrobiae bacterium]|nr:hypothetical protein [Verrucomicrobiae bacterium]
MTMLESIAAARKSGPLPQADGANLFEFHFGADEPVFAGHFPGRPILPGIFQLEMARMAAENVLRCRLSVREIIKAKFLSPVLPGETIRLSLKWNNHDGGIRVSVEFFAAEREVGKAVLQLCRTE